MKLRSQWEFGEASECRRGLMRGMGYSDEELKRPIIGIVNSWNEYNPGHVHLQKVAERVKAGIREAGGLPVEVMLQSFSLVRSIMFSKNSQHLAIASESLLIIDEIISHKTLLSCLEIYP